MLIGPIISLHISTERHCIAYQVAVIFTCAPDLGPQVAWAKKKKNGLNAGI